MKPQTLVILSLPFQRLIRSHLSPMVMEVLSSQADLVIVTPFASDPLFCNRYVRPGVMTLSPPILERLSWLPRKLVAISSMLRMHGYWFRRRYLIPYDWAIRHLQFGENGNDRKLGLGHKLLVDTLGLVGYSPKAWRIFDFLHGHRTYNFPELLDMAAKYEKVVFIQAASWGFQDAVLGYWARRKHWRSILLPYTTDQLFCNGWLYCDFNKVCVQGEAETHFAEELHSIKKKSVVRLGSLNAFSIRTVMKEKEIAARPNPNNQFRILYSGSTATYFPVESEFRCLDAIVDAINSGAFGNASITYRPLGHNGKIREQIHNRYGTCKEIQIEYANPAIYGLNNYENMEFNETLSSHIEALTGYHLLIMAGFTSLSIDVAILGIPSVAMFIDKTGTLKKRYSNLMLDNMGRLKYFSMIPVVREEESLIKTIASLIVNHDEREKIVKEILLAWDYPNTDMMEELKKVIFE